MLFYDLKFGFIILYLGKIYSQTGGPVEQEIVLDENKLRSYVFFLLWYGNKHNRVGIGSDFAIESQDNQQIWRCKLNSNSDQVILRRFYLNFFPYCFNNIEIVFLIALVILSWICITWNINTMAPKKYKNILFLVLVGEYKRESLLKWFTKKSRILP